MSKLLELIEENRNIIVAVSLADLIECNEALIYRVKAELEQQITDATPVLQRSLKCSMSTKRPFGVG